MVSFKLSEGQELLCLCIRHIDFIERDRIVELYESLGDDAVYALAKHNGVNSIVAHVLKVIYGDENIPLHWNEDYSQIENRIECYMNELEKVATLLANNDIPLLALKNSGITIGMYPHFGSCPMGDVDVLVSKTKFRKAHEILSKSGYTLKFRSPLEEDNIEAAEHGGGAEYSVELENGQHLWFELQWRPVAGRWIQPEQEPSADELVERSVEISGSNVRLLSPEDNLLQVSLHTAKHTFVRAPGFRLHTDVDRIVSTQDIDWELFTSRVLELKTKTAVFMSLAMAKTLLKTPVPQKVLEDLSPRRWKVRLMNRWLEKVGIFDPDGKKWGRLGYIVFVSLLYDDFSDFMKGIIPSPKQMKEQYEFNSSLALPYYYAKRILGLVFRRVRT